MATNDFYDKPYDSGTLTKLKIFELYTQEWIPVFLSPPSPQVQEVHIFDFFSGPGHDTGGITGSPLRILDQLRRYHEKGLACWNKITIAAHFFDSSQRHISQLESTLKLPEWTVPGVQVECRQMAFEDALANHKSLLSNPRIAKLLIIDQFGVDEVSDEVFKRLISSQKADFMFFLSSSTLHRFHDHPAIKQKIDRPGDSYDVHRAAFNYFRGLVPADMEIFLAPFSIKKRSNIYGLIFGSQHPLGIHKFLQVAWKNDEIAGEADFDIEHDNIQSGELLLALPEMRPTKIREFEAKLEKELRAGKLRSEAAVMRVCIEAGMTCQHSAPVLKKLKSEGLIDLQFRVPDVHRFSSPRTINING
jgi:three-Cys-motif partner protein